jgi:hydroxypyruvate reductase
MRSVDSHEHLLRTMFAAAVARARPEVCLPAHLPEPPAGRTIVVGAGKAAASMARAVEEHWPAPVQGVVVTRYGHGLPCKHIEVLEAGHPLPDERSVTGARQLLDAVDGLSAGDLVLCLLSGGGSALLAALPPGVTLEEERVLTAALLRSGATIGEINCVRRQISLIRGGRLAAAAAPAQVVTLAISDVPGDDPSAIASGPTVPDHGTASDALAVLHRHAIAPPPGIARWLGRPARDDPTPGPFEADFRIIATARDALDAAAAVASDAGFTPFILGDAIEGEAREVARTHAEAARRLAERDGRCLLLSGGETSVTVRGPGRGGRNCEYLLALGLTLSDRTDVWALAADTDGVDGSEDNAGAVWTPHTLAVASERGFDAADHLARNDAYGFFAGVDQLVMTGPTHTNVNDFRAVLIAPHASTRTRT